ncbi:MAG: VOC family protein [Dehalococcoidia bacterium]
MAINLDHTIVPAHDKVAAAEWFAKIFGLKYEGPTGHFAPIKVNDTLTLDFDNADNFDSHHYAFHISEEDFDSIFGRIKEEGIPYGAEPYDLENGKLNNRLGGRGVYFRDLDGHILELMTRR